MRGHHGDNEEESPLDDIIRHFNERFFSAWDATPEEQRVKLINIMEHVQQSAAYKAQRAAHPSASNPQNSLEPTGGLAGSGRSWSRWVRQIS